ncbi:hypothetical protein [Symmachiella dynata]|uniref:hypothetical protein n=1 Tax=Symmachiella dynata TaxID=2527995 RepID=UPI0018D46EAD|nr:hypothetical protein [Symmachiella dynata]
MEDQPQCKFCPNATAEGFRLCSDCRAKAGKRRHDPTPAEIRAACAEIQAKWSQAEEYQSRTGRH